MVWIFVCVNNGLKAQWFGKIVCANNGLKAQWFPQPSGNALGKRSLLQQKKRGKIYTLPLSYNDVARGGIEPPFQE